MAISLYPIFLLCSVQSINKSCKNQSLQSFEISMSPFGFGLPGDVLLHCVIAVSAGYVLYMFAIS